MILQELHMKNIRSYKEANIYFEEGSTLLSGDIGSGKTSILLSIEFALFGLLRGELSGEHLLRFGCKEGVVSLTFKIGDDDVEIKRTLKKSGGSVQQGTGHIGVNGVFEEKTARELKSTILDILGYPNDLLHKNPEMFRYTVYTPQEDMKRILYEKEEDRLVQLRKVFDLDKYERVKNNADLYGRELRRKKKNLRTKFEDLDEKKRLLSEEKQEQEDLANKHKKIKAKLKKKQEEVNKAKKDVKRLEESEEDIQKKEQEYHSKKQLLQHKQETISKLQKDIQTLQKELEQTQLDKEPTPPQKTLQECQELEQKIRQKEKALRHKNEEANKKIVSVNQRIKDSQKLIKDIHDLDTCPTCNQEVTENHKQQVQKREKQKIQEYDNKETRFQTFKQKIQEKLDVLETKKNKLNKLMQKAKSYQDTKKYVEKAKKDKKKKQQKIQELQEQKKNLKTEETHLQKSVENLKETVTKNKDFKQKIQEKRNLKEKLQQELHQYNQEQTKIQEKQKYIQKEIRRLQESVEEMKEFKTLYEQNRNVEDWLSNHFTNVVSTIEKHVFMKIHERFNNYFQNWFNILIEDEDFTARLDQRFTPLLSQASHETTIENLSGGEKTSVALSYRLALNRVVNEFLTGIKTKDLLILDEPTDGFSMDQLDKVRDVLDALDCKQTIIVSHEPKLESYTENIIRIQKKHGESHIA